MLGYLGLRRDPSNLKTRANCESAGLGSAAKVKYKGNLRLAQCLLYASSVGTWTRSDSGHQYAKFPKKVRLPEVLELV